MTPRDRLARMTAATEAPALNDADLDELLRGARRIDAAGLPPTDTAWTPTYDLNAAAAEGWRWKQARVAGTQIRESFDGDYGSADFRALEFARIAQYYEHKQVGSVRIGTVYP